MKSTDDPDVAGDVSKSHPSDRALRFSLAAGALTLSPSSVRGDGDDRSRARTIARKDVGQVARGSGTSVP